MPSKAGTTYRGSFHPALGRSYAAPISFTVTAGGKRVGGFRYGTNNQPPPFNARRCSGGSWGVPKPGSAAVSAAGTFRVTLTLTGTARYPQLVHGTLVITGRFLAHGRERGTISSHFAGRASRCNATVSYTAAG